MKKMVTLMLVLVLTLGCVSAEMAAYVPGTYSATVSGRNGDMTVTMTFSADAMESITVQSVETETIGVTAMDLMIEDILANQSFGVDIIAGATISCEALMDALERCTQQAGGDVEALKSVEVAKADKKPLVTEADVIVVGAGGAGLTAAVTAYENGASVILLEKSAMVGGNTVCATMGINAAESKVQEAAGVSKTVEEFVEMQMNNEDAREELVRALCEKSGETIDWLTSLGVEFTVGGNSDFMLMAEADGKTSVTLVNAVSAALKNTEVNFYSNTTVIELVTDESGAVTGVMAETADGEKVTFSGKAVILATGGFGQNRDLLGQVRPDLATAITDEIAPTMGEGLMMAQAIGAATVNLDSIQLFPHVINGYGLLVPFGIPGGFHPDAIFVNNNGKRFTAEGFEISEAILAQPDGMAYCIFNEDKLTGMLARAKAAGFVKTADTAEELANLLGINGEQLTATIEKWNADCANSEDTAFGRKDNLNPIEGKLCGYNFGVGAHYFMGGILINENTQVMDVNGKAIEGLFAAGEVTGGFHGTYRVDGCGTADAFVFGRIAGETTAAKAAEK